MNGQKLFWFPFEPMSWLTDSYVTAMSFAAQGMYMRLLCSQAVNGSIPADPVAVQRLLGARDAEFEAEWPMIRTRFVERNGVLQNLKLADCMEKQRAKHEALSESGARGNKKRWGTSPPESPGESPPESQKNRDRVDSIGRDTLKNQNNNNPTLADSTSRIGVGGLPFGKDGHWVAATPDHQMASPLPIVEGVALPTTNFELPTESSEAPTRRIRVPTPLPEIPEAVRIDYERLVANDAGRRKDGKIAESVVAQDALMLRRAYERHGLDALTHGIDVALGKGKGVKYAAGCARNYDGESGGTFGPAAQGGGTYGRPDPREHGGRAFLPDVVALTSTPEYTANLYAARLAKCREWERISPDVPRMSGDWAWYLRYKQEHPEEFTDGR